MVRSILIKEGSEFLKGYYYLMRLDFNGGAVNSFLFPNSYMYYQPMENSIACLPSGDFYMVFRDNA